MRRRLFLLLVIIGIAGTARAATIDGASLPDSFALGARTLVLNGIGIRTLTIFNVRAYVAGLYLPARSHDASAILVANEPKVLLMQFLHSATKAQIDDHYREGERNNCGKGGCNAADQADFERLVAATPAAAVGDTLTYVFTPGRVEALFNNRPIGSFANPDLATRLLAGFIGDAPPSASLKRELLGLPAD